MRTILPQILRRVQTSPAESIVLQTIAYRANVQGQNARISYEALAAATDFSERWVIELIRRLEAKHLLRVQRRWLAPSRCAINIYSIVRPWLRELSYAQAYQRKQERSVPAQISTDGSVHPEPIRERNQLQTTYQSPDQSPCTHQECLKAGLTEGSIAYRHARGLEEKSYEGL